MASDGRRCYPGAAHQRGRSHGWARYRPQAGWG